LKKAKKKQDIAKDFGIPASTLSTIIKNKDVILKNINENSATRKKMKLGEYSDIESCLLKWFQQCLDRKIPINGPILREKAEEFGHKLGHEHFKASSGWLTNWKNRNSVVFKQVCGESGAVDVQKCSVWINNLPKLIENYSPDDIFNVDETRLFFKCLPDKTFIFKGQSCSGGKHSKERVTLLLGANMSGTEKLRPLLIGKSKKPRCFKQVKSLPLDYYANKKSWMTSEIFNLWLMKLDKKMVSEKRKILLFIDNCTAHNLTSTFNAIKVQFLPPNTTSVLQPLDQGIINNFKIFYRKEMVKKIVSAINDTNQIVINIWDAIRLCDKAWRHVKKETIVNCFTKSGFRTSTENIPDEPSDDNNDEWDQLNLNETFTSYVKVDENLEICGEWTENDIISDILDEDNEEEIEDQQIQSTITNKEAKLALETLRKYIEGNEGMEDLFKPLGTLENRIENNVLNKQKQLT